VNLELTHLKGIRDFLIFKFKSVSHKNQECHKINTRFSNSNSTFMRRNFTIRLKKQKTYRRFLGMISWERFGLLVIPALQWLTDRKPLKIAKT
jgi:hypothetical protein